MVQKYTNPLTIHFTKEEQSYDQARNVLKIKATSRWRDFMDSYNQVGTIPHDYIMIAMDDQTTLSDYEKSSIDFKTNYIARDAYKKQGVKTYAFSRMDNQFYQLTNEYKSLKPYGPTDEMLKQHTKQFGYDIDNPETSPRQWQEHQAQVFQELKNLMPLKDKTDQYNKVNHKAELTSPKRGLDDDDIKDMFSWESNKILNPNLLNDTLLGIPGVNGRKVEGEEFYFKGRLIGVDPIQVTTAGASGYVIPMKNAYGHMTKFQLGTDLEVYNTRLKIRAKDGVSIQQSEFYDKSKNLYLFKDTNGHPMDLRIKAVEGNTISFQDNAGDFTADFKSDIKDVLIQRGYHIPPIMDTIKTDITAKYSWTAPGTYTGSKAVQKRISPSEAGFIKVSEPIQGNDKYTVLVVEGALKGQIVSKYVNQPDRNGHSIGGILTHKDGNGLIIAQVPGVAKAFVESVANIHENYKVDKMAIAMDADGRENKSVAKGIHDSYNYLQNENVQVTVMSWDPKQKGLDDALLAVNRGEITMSDMGLKFGPPEKLFPLDQAKSPNPYKLDGTRANKESWRLEDDINQVERAKKIAQAQQTAVESVAPPIDIENFASSVDQLLEVKDHFKTIVSTNPTMKESLGELQKSLSESLADLDMGGLQQ